MELKELFVLLKKYSLTLLVVSLFLGAIGVALYYFLPQRYIATGSFYVTRAVEPISTEFSYEGYYSRQAALSYTKTFMGLLESVDVRKQTLEDLGIPVNGEALRKYGRKIRVKDVAPQLVRLEVKGDSVSEVENFWKGVSSAAVATSQRLNSGGDPLVTVVSVGDSLVVREVYKNVVVNFVGGLGLGFLIGGIAISLKEYLS